MTRDYFFFTIHIHQKGTHIIFYMYHIIIIKAWLLLYIFLSFHLSRFQKSVTQYTYFTIDDFYRSNIDFLIYLFNLSVCFHLPMIVLSILFLRCFLCFSPNTTSSKLKKTSLKPEYTAHRTPHTTHHFTSGIISEEESRRIFWFV